jgi:hypothetical protein
VSLGQLTKARPAQLTKTAQLTNARPAQTDGKMRPAWQLGWADLMLELLEVSTGAPVAAMDHHVSSSSVQQSGSGVLATLASAAAAAAGTGAGAARGGEEGVGAAVHDAMVRLGAVDSVLTAMFSFPALAQLQVRDGGW